MPARIARRAPAAKPPRKPASKVRRTTARADRLRDQTRRDALSAAIPYLATVRAPSVPLPARRLGQHFSVATYNVHRWSGINGTRAPDPARAGFVISELDADIIALQEVLRPFDRQDPLERIADSLQRHMAFVTTRVHKRGEVGNAILSRWPITSIFSLDLSYGRMERRSAVAAEFLSERGGVSVVATHLALVDRTRRRQVRAILENPRLQGPAVLLGDMNAWRRCKATRDLEHELVGGDEMTWPRTFPASRPILALDRVYARGAVLSHIEAHASSAARKASDHLPVVAHVEIAAGEGPER